MLGTNHTVALLDGTPPGDDSLALTLAVLTDVLEQERAEVQVFPLAQTKLAHCIGCFACFVETPGLCRYHEADGVAILQSVVQSDTVVLFTPVTFGGYGSTLKQIVDRCVSLIHPYFELDHGEVHHVARYTRYPRWVAVGAQPRPDPEEARLFHLLAGRNAINFHSPSYAAEIVTTGDRPDELRARFRSLIDRSQAFPWDDAVRPLLRAPEQLPLLDRPGRACLLVGSPKTLKPSTSGVLGSYLIDRLQEKGWESETLTLGPAILKDRGQADLLAAVDRADLLVIAFPLYVDALPFLLTRALEIVAAPRRDGASPRPQRLVAIANSGFPEAYQSYLALAICRRFAAEAGMAWAGGLALGAGEGIVGGQPLQARMPSGSPASHVMQALDASAAALTRGEPIPAGAVREMARTPVPLVPLFLWRRMIVQGTRGWWDHQATPHGVSKEALFARPYEVAARR